jgi:hypothetical protein
MRPIPLIATRMLPGNLAANIPKKVVGSVDQFSFNKIDQLKKVGCVLV